jgi:predicted nucleic acid-binding protein
MPEAEAVLDASPLILLSRSGHLDLLLSLKRPLVMPVPVFEEIHAKGSQDSTVRSVERAAFLKIVPSPPIPDAIERWDLGRGESSVLALAMDRPGALALLDDMEARRGARADLRYRALASAPAAGGR